MSKQLQRTNLSNGVLHVVVLKAIIVISSLIVFFSSCQKEETVDAEARLVIQEEEANNPNCTCDPYISQYKWHNETVYVLAYKGPACSWFPTYYDADGKRFTMAQAMTFDDFLQQSLFIKTVWTCK